MIALTTPQTVALILLGLFAAGVLVALLDVWASVAIPAAWAAVVLDPEDRQQMERLRDALGAPTSPLGFGWQWLQRVLRSLTVDPKPDEPTGLGAVVEDTEGDRWVRWTCDPDPEIQPWTAADEGGADHVWADLAAVKVLSEGVTP